MILRYLFITLLATLAFLPGNAQQEIIDKQFDDAEFFFATEEYREALYIFKQLLELQPENHNFNFRAGMSCLNIEGEESNAIPYLLKATENTSLKYKERDLRETRAPHHSWFYLGNAYRINNELEKALESYRIFKDIRNFEKHYNSRIVDAEIKACERAKIITDAPVNVSFVNAGPQINKGQRNYHPVLNGIESVMFFMQSQRFYEAVMYTYKVEGNWVEPVNITPQIGSDGDMVPTGVSEDGTKLLLVRRTNSSNGDIFLSKKDGNTWSKAEKLPPPVNSARNEHHASFSPDGKSILFSSDRSGGFGGLDIWFAEIMDDGTFGKPVNAGSGVNTAGNETSPFLSKDGKTLYFASTGHFNMGGYDIFHSSKKADGNWGDVNNLGFPVNTTNDNSFYQPTGDGTTGLLSLFKRTGSYSNEDIWRIEMMPLLEPMPFKRILFNEDFTLTITDEETGEKITINYNRATDSMRVSSSSGRKLIINTDVP